MTKPSPRRTAALLKKLSRLRPELAIVLGSGFGSLADAVQVDAQISYSKLSGFRPTGVGGHRGELLFGTLGGYPVMLLNGRAHYYEGHSMAEITFPIRTLTVYGIRSLLVTCAAGGINRRYRVGDFMVFTDHINWMGTNPLRGEWAPDETRFVDLTTAYDPGLNRLLKRAAQATRVTLRNGVYLAVSGPSYETPAEIRAFARLGADAVGMSAVPEVIVSRQCGLLVAAVACITNPAADRGRATLSHRDVLKQAKRLENTAVGWLTRFVQLLANGRKGRRAPGLREDDNGVPLFPP
jgi:purine-nucleoside phosphorylase